MTYSQSTNRFNSLDKLLREIETDDKTFFTHTSSERKKKYCMTRGFIENFYDLYDGKIGHTLTEIPQHYSMFRIDIDIKKKEYSNDYKPKEKFYTEKQVLFIIETLQKQLQKVVAFDNFGELGTCFLFEKEPYLKKENEWSNGFHLQFPYMFLETKFMYERILKPIKDIVKKETGLDFDNMYKNAWYIYGSRKQMDREPYVLTKIYNSSLKEMTLMDSLTNYQVYDTNEDVIKITNENVEKLLPRILSIIPFCRQTYEFRPELVFIDNDKIPEKPKPKRNDNRNVDEKLQECRKLIPLLNDTRLEDYHDWMSLGWCLYCIGEGCYEALEIWDEASQRAPNYDSGACDTAWEKMTIKNYSLGTLHYWAKEDSPEEYEKLFSKKCNWVRELIFDMTDLNCAKLFKEHNDGEIFYTNSHKWTTFNRDTKFWTFNGDKASLSNPICQFFTDAIKEYQEEFTKKYDPENEADEKHLKAIMKARKKVGMTKFASGIIPQLQKLMEVDSEIMDTFEMNPNLIAFKNGKVFDLEKNEIREIVKEDKIIITTGYDLPERNNDDIEKAKTILNSVVKTPEDLKVILTSLSCSLYGKNKNELFFVYTGTGGNSKGLLFTWLKAVLGRYYNTVNVNQLTTYEKDGNRANSELTACQYARCVMTTEPDTSTGSKLVVPVIKKWTGNDDITTRDLNCKSFQFTPRFTLYLQCNNIPELSTTGDDASATKRRMNCIELPFEFKADPKDVILPHHRLADTTLKEKIVKPEYRDAFLWILIDTWIENNGGFYKSEKVKEFTNNYFEIQNPVKIWFNENYEIDENGKCNPTDMLTEYQNETYEYTMTPTKFGKLLKEFCKTKKTNKGLIYLCKKKIVNEPDEPERLLK